MSISIAFILLPALYLLLLTTYALVFFFKRRTSDGYHAEDIHSFTIGVVFRNETENLKELVRSFSEIQYPAYGIEFIFCDDHSEDGSLELLEELLQDFPLPNRVLKLENGTGKKAGLKWIAEHAQHEFLLLTDADCQPIPTWVAAFNAFVQEHPDASCILGPLQFCAEAPFIEKYQVLENTGLIMIGASSLQLGMPLMANGGNICYRKKEFQELCAFSKNEKIPTGDDIVMLDAFHAKYPKDCYFLKSPQAMIRTLVQKGWREFFSQRLRWSKKGFSKGDPGKFIAQSFIAGAFILMIATLFLLPFGILQPWVLLIWPAKIGVDLFFFAVMNAFFKTKVSLADRILSSLVQVFIIPIIAVSGRFVGYNWKGRSHS